MSDNFSLPNERFQGEKKTNLGLHYIYQKAIKTTKIHIGSSCWYKSGINFTGYNKTKFYVLQLLNEHSVANL